MEYAGRYGDWAAYSRGDKTVFVNVTTFDTTDPIDTALVASASGVVHETETEDVENFARESFVGLSVFSASFGEDEMIKIPADVKAAAKRAIEWRRIYNRGGTDVGANTARMLAKHDRISIRKVRHIAKYFPRHEVDNKAEGWKSGEKGFPSAGRVAWDLWGGDAGRRWASAQVKRADKRALVAAAYVVDEPDTEEVTGNEYDSTSPHVFHPITQLPYSCMYCMKSPDDGIHDENAVDYYVQDVDPDWAHLFYADPIDETVCAICGQADDAWQHEHAAYALSVTHPDTNQIVADLYQPVAPRKTIVASLLSFNSERVNEYKSNLFGAVNDDTDYYVSVSNSDNMLATGLFKETDNGWYEWEASASCWVKSSPSSPVYLVDVDLETAQFVVNSFADFNSGHTADLRLADPEEFELHQNYMQDVDWDFIDTLLIRTPAFSVFATVVDGEYTPEERAKNAKRQVRDKNGRFAKTSSKVYLPDGSSGTITKINPENQSVTVQTEDGKQQDISAKEVVIRSPQPITKQDLDKIKAVPRAVRRDQKAGGIDLLPPMDSETLKQVVADYAQYIRDERAGAQFSELKEVDGVKLYERIDDFDVKPLYMALVDKDDNDAVLDLLALIPASTEGAEVQLVRRTDKGWEIDDEIKDSLTSSVPPPIVKLDDTQFAGIEEQVLSWYNQASKDVSSEQAPVVASLYDDFGTLVAAGGADRNRGNAEELRRYWTTGKGGLKIRWNTPGDWTRCYRHLKKYMGPRAKGYCSLRHKEMTGTWPGSKNNIGNRKRKFSNSSMFFTAGDLFDLNTEEEVLSLVACGANMNDEYIPEIPQEIEIEGGGMPFRIPTVAPVNIESGDGRLIRPMALTYRDLPIPLMWQIKTGTGHDGAVVVGRIDSIEMLPNGSLGNARGMFDTNPYAREAQRMVKEGFLRGVSVDLDRFQAISKADESLKEASENENIIGNDKTEISQGRVMGVTIVPKPAFQECSIEIDYDAMSGEVPEVVDGMYAGSPSDDKDAEAIVAAALIAAGIPVAPPSSWFNNPNLDKPTPLTVENDGRVFGHIATWATDHIGLPFATKPPRSRSSYAYFHTGSLHTEDGDLVPVGQITLTGGHAPLDASAASAAAHYDNTRSAWCDVHAGEDEFGIWVAGALRPSVSPEQIRAVRASAPSGDWRPVNGRLEMVAVCSVNVPGFPVTRAFVASGSLLSLVAAGTATLLEQYKTADNSVLDELALRVARLEGPQRDKLEALRMASLDRRAIEVRTKFEELASFSAAEFRDYNEETRAKYAKEGIAMPDGSYPIENEADLRNAIQAYGRAKDKEAAKKHIISRARALKATDSLPGKWQEAALIASAEDIQAKFESMGVKTLAQRYSEANAKFEAFATGPQDFDPLAHPRDAEGKFRGVLARLKDDVEEARSDAGDEKTDSKVADIKKIDDKLVGGDLNAAKIAGQKLILALDRTDTEVGDARLAERLRDDYAILGDVVYNIGVPLGADKTLRYSELPEELKNFIDQLIAKVNNLSADDEEAKAVEFLNKYMGGNRQLTQAEISASLSKLVRILI